MYKTVQGRWGTTTFFGKDMYVGRSMYSYGEYGPDETEMILTLAGNGVCLDIGANIGCISQALSASGKEVIAFEPQPEVFKLLKVNCPNIEAYNVGLGVDPRIAKMAKVYYSERGNFGGLGLDERSEFGTIDVEVRTLDSYNFQDISFIKIDVEGFETEVLCGGTDTISRCRPIMYIEDDRINNRTKLRNQIKEMGYSIVEHTPALYRENNFFNLRKNIWDANYVSYNLIARPC